MLIANPIYDTAFKYFMQDEKIAKGFIGRIIDQEILEIQFNPTEYAVYVDFFDGKAMRMDFNAIIKNKNGETQKVLIELQKSKKTLDIKRFREYLSEQYKKQDGVRIKKIKDKKVEIPEYYPIITIYLLGYSYNKNFPATVGIEHTYKDLNTKQILNVDKDKFIERLVHNSYIVQLTKLDKNIKTPLDRILTLFDQKKRTKKKELLEYPEEEADRFSEDELLQKALRRLNSIVLEEKLRKELEFEEELEEKFSNVFKELEEKKKALEDNKKALEDNKKALEDKDKALEDKDKALEDNKKALEDKDKALEDKDKALEDNKKALEDKDKALEESNRIIEELRKKLSA